MSKNFVSELIRKKQLDWLNVSIKSLDIIHNFIFSSREKIRRFGFLDIAQKQLLLLIDVGLKQANKTINKKLLLLGYFIPATEMTLGQMSFLFLAYRSYFWLAYLLCF